ncbi:unnamed protein product [Chrysodeixis includens]|uniref:Uncharacterized protein n=1 Tax=Chrysodeixis includens TaxID=689277 RepID=A0A9N8KZN8_CHRIL|nr:unnamed protein product [Chrysodeixis includens]
MPYCLFSSMFCRSSVSTNRVLASISELIFPNTKPSTAFLMPNLACVTPSSLRFSLVCSSPTASCTHTRPVSLRYWHAPASHTAHTSKHSDTRPSPLASLCYVKLNIMLTSN